MSPRPGPCPPARACMRCPNVSKAWSPTSPILHGVSEKCHFAQPGCARQRVLVRYSDGYRVVVGRCWYPGGGAGVLVQVQGTGTGYWYWALVSWPLSWPHWSPALASLATCPSLTVTCPGLTGLGTTGLGTTGLGLHGLGHWPWSP